MAEQQKTTMTKTCAICGKAFESAHGKARYCGDECRKSAERELARKRRAEAGYKERRKAQWASCAARKERLSRLAARDAAWAAWEKENGAAPTVEVVGGRVIERRGNCRQFRRPHTSSGQAAPAAGEKDLLASRRPCSGSLVGDLG